MSLSGSYHYRIVLWGRNRFAIFGALVVKYDTYNFQIIMSWFTKRAPVIQTPERISCFSRLINFHIYRDTISLFLNLFPLGSPNTSTWLIGYERNKFEKRGPIGWIPGKSQHLGIICKSGRPGLVYCKMVSMCIVLLPSFLVGKLPLVWATHVAAYHYGR